MNLNNIKIKNEDLLDIMSNAVCGSDWIYSITSSVNKKEFAEENIVYKNAILTIRPNDTNEDVSYNLTKEQFKNALSECILEDRVPLEQNNSGKWQINTCKCDALISDYILQRALFGKVVYL